MSDETHPALLRTLREMRDGQREIAGRLSKLQVLSDEHYGQARAAISQSVEPIACVGSCGVGRRGGFDRGWRTLTG